MPTLKVFNPDGKGHKLRDIKAELSGKVFMHYKRKSLYRVTDYRFNAEFDTWDVVYEKLYISGEPEYDEVTVFHRSYDNFVEEIDGQRRFMEVSA